MNVRQLNRLVEVASGSGGVLQDMVDEATTGLSGADGGGVPLEDAEMASQSQERANASSQPRGNGWCPITDADEKPFPLMMLPAEIRNEVYRACLTRPFNILLSKREPPAPEPEPEKESEAPDAISISSDSDDETQEDTASAMQSLLQRQRDIITPVLPHASQPATSSSSQTQSTALRAWANRGSRPIRLLTTRSTTYVNNVNTNSTTNTGAVLGRSASRRSRPGSRPAKMEQPREPRPQDIDPLIVNLLRASKTVYQEARSILYNENLFTLDLETALPTLAALHQRSRRQIKHVELEIPCYNEILERFQETVRLSLRYCWGLKKFVINMPFVLPGADGSGTTGNTTVYANGFDILRWLPRQCEVVLQGSVCTEIESVVSKNANLAKTLDEVCNAARQHHPIHLCDPSDTTCAAGMCGGMLSKVLKAVRLS